VNYPKEFLYSLDLYGVTPYTLPLKFGSLIILFAIHLDYTIELDLLSKKLLTNVIKATILNGKSNGEDALIPSIPTDMPFDFKRLQHPIRLIFVMTINIQQCTRPITLSALVKSPKSLSHGQLNVACTRVEQQKNVFVFAKDAQTKNIVYLVALV